MLAVPHTRTVAIQLLLALILSGQPRSLHAAESFTDAAGATRHGLRVTDVVWRAHAKENLPWVLRLVRAVDVADATLRRGPERARAGDSQASANEGQRGIGNRTRLGKRTRASRSHQILGASLATEIAKLREEQQTRPPQDWKGWNKTPAFQPVVPAFLRLLSPALVQDNNPGRRPGANSGAWWYDLSLVNRLTSPHDGTAPIGKRLRNSLTQLYAASPAPEGLTHPRVDWHVILSGLDEATAQAIAEESLVPGTLRHAFFPDMSSFEAVGGPRPRGMGPVANARGALLGTVPQGHAAEALRASGLLPEKPLHRVPWSGRPAPAAEDALRNPLASEESLELFKSHYGTTLYTHKTHLTDDRFLIFARNAGLALRQSPEADADDFIPHWINTQLRILEREAPEILNGPHPAFPLMEDGGRVVEVAMRCLKRPSHLPYARLFTFVEQTAGGIHRLRQLDEELGGLPSYGVNVAHARPKHELSSSGYAHAIVGRSLYEVRALRKQGLPLGELRGASVGVGRIGEELLQKMYLRGMQSVGFDPNPARNPETLPWTQKLRSLGPSFSAEFRAIANRKGPSTNGLLCHLLNTEQLPRRAPSTAQAIAENNLIFVASPAPGSVSPEHLEAAAKLDPHWGKDNAVRIFVNAASPQSMAPFDGPGIEHAKQWVDDYGLIHGLVANRDIVLGHASHPEDADRAVRFRGAWLVQLRGGNQVINGRTDINSLRQSGWPGHSERDLTQLSNDGLWPAEYGGDNMPPGHMIGVTFGVLHGALHQAMSSHARRDRPGLQAYGELDSNPELAKVLNHLGEVSMQTSIRAGRRHKLFGMTLERW